MNNTNETGTRGAASLLEGTTPGPWENADGLIVGEDYIATVFDHSNPQCSAAYAAENAVLRNRSKANARLIAAAPALAASHAELVAALEATVRAFDEYSDEMRKRGWGHGQFGSHADSCSWSAQCRTALANARKVTEGGAG